MRVALLLAAACFPQETPRFVLHESLWLNLHHFLYAVAQKTAFDEGETLKTRPVAILPDDEGRLGALTEDERAVWTKSVRYYREAVIFRDLLFDEGMVAVKSTLQAGGPGALSDSALASALEGAEPVYRARFWEEHQRVNCAWARALLPLEERFGERLTSKLAAAYGTPWPIGRIRVDVVRFSNWAGAYTSNDPTHVTIASTDPDIQGSAALEILFHEASHGVDAAIMESIERASRRFQKSAPHLLWHALLFFTTGELVRRDVGGDYVPYAVKEGLYEREPFRRYRRALEAHWLLHLDGKTALEPALEAVIREIYWP